MKRAAGGRIIRKICEYSDTRSSQRNDEEVKNHFELLWGACLAICSPGSLGRWAVVGPRNLSCKKLIQQQKVKKKVHAADMIAQEAVNETTKRQKKNEDGETSTNNRIRTSSHTTNNKNGFYSFRAQTDEDHPVDPDSYTVVARGVADLYP